MPTDEEIREVCARLLTANDSDFESLVQELRRGLRSRFEKISNLAVAATLKMPRSKKAIEDKEETGNREKARYGT